jgi:geranylgeranyl pyrophosphate synthase
MDFGKRMESYRKEINASLEDIFTRQKPEILYEPMRYAVNIGGKRVRPILCGIFLQDA